MEKYEPQNKYDAQNTVQLKLKLNKKTDADILDWLDGLENKQGMIKLILREHIERCKMIQISNIVDPETWKLLQGKIDPHAQVYRVEDIGLPRGYKMDGDKIVIDEEQKEAVIADFNRMYPQGKE